MNGHANIVKEVSEIVDKWYYESDLRHGATLSDLIAELRAALGYIDECPSEVAEIGDHTGLNRF
jgi:hypothetical protein